MNFQNLNKTQIAICKLVTETYVEKQVLNIDERINFVSKLKKELSLLKIDSDYNTLTETKYSKAAKKFHQNVKKIIGDEKLKLKPTNITEEYSTYIFENDRLLNSKYKIDGDSSEVTKLKFKLFGKSKKKYLEQISKNNIRNINYSIFKNQILQIIFDETKRYNSIIAASYLSIYKSIIAFNSYYHSKVFSQEKEKSSHEEQIEINNLTKELEEVSTTLNKLKQNTKNDFEERIDKLVEKYEEACNLIKDSKKIVSEYSYKNIQSEKIKFDFQSKIHNKKHEDFYKGLFGNWNFFEDISTLNYFILVEFFETRDKLNRNLHTEIISEFNKIIQIFESMRIEFDDNKDSEKFINYLQNKKLSIKHMLEDDLLIQIVRLLPYDNPAPIINAYLGKLKTIISTLPEQRTVTNINELNYSSNTELQTFSSKEIIENNIFNSAFNNQSELTKTSRANVKTISSEVLGLGQISDYNFETAISVGINDKKMNGSGDENSTYKIAVEGVDRLIDNCKDISNQLLKLSDSIFKEFYLSIIKFTDNLFKLNNSDELIKLKHKLSREKRKEETQQKIETAKTNIKSFFPLVFSKSKILYSTAKEKLFKIGEKVGLTNVPQEVSEEILNYIVETEKQIERLPFIYQRLFKNSPVQDKRFFIGREKELEKIHKAYYHWGKGKFAPVVVVSEKGAGASSLTNIAQDEFEQSLDVIHIRLRNTIYKTKDFLNLLSEKFNEKNVVNLDDLVNRINSRETKHVIIIENIEDFFLRIVNGFDVLKKFVQLISLTNKNFFWIATCNKYAWNYLNKVMNIEDYFAFIIRFDRFTNKNIKKIIMTRHSMSGYRLKFIPSEKNLNDKQYLKLNEQLKQGFLTKNFFYELNEISQSNVALAQLFWLRSISKLTENEIHIFSLHNIDFSFIKNLSRQKVFSLAAILIHDGLTIEEHAKVFNMSIEESRLLLSAMLDDGELSKTNGNYRVNFLLYVHVIKLLISQNILH